MINLHHTHLFCSDVDATIRWWQDAFGAEVVGDLEFAGARNVFIRVGSGRIHLYDQPPRQPGEGTVHHLGVQTDEFEVLFEHLRDFGASLGEVRGSAGGRYVMVGAPDGLLVEVFELDQGVLPKELRDFFALSPDSGA